MVHGVAPLLHLPGVPCELLTAPPLLNHSCRGVVVALHQLGMSCVLLTGDNWRTARAIAEQLGISQVAAEVLPAGKVSMIKVGGWVW